MSAVQLGATRGDPASPGLLALLAIILLVLAVGAVMGPALSLAVSSARGAIRSRRSRRRRLQSAADAEARARALMSCARTAGGLRSRCTPARIRTTTGP
jgi:hypothetical protein